MSACEPVLELVSVSRSFGRKRDDRVEAMVEVSLSLCPGEILAVIGPSGSGKTTLANICLGLDRPSSGSVRWRGSDVRAMSRRGMQLAKSENRLVTQDPFGALHPGMTIRRIVEEPLRVSKIPREGWSSAVDLAFTQVGLDQSIYRDLFPHQLSGGQRQRVAIARATVGGPKLIVADEPTSMLDVSVRAGITVLLNEIRQQLPVGILLITHDLGLARYVADRVIVLEKGRVVESGAIKQVFSCPQAQMTKALLGRPTTSDKAM